MRCPFCAFDDSRVIDSRPAEDGGNVRRRQCESCGERFSTIERAELKPPAVRKNDDRRENFDGEKLRGGMKRALEKRPVDTAAVERAVNNILHRLAACGRSEISSRAIGEAVMHELRALDHVAYVRFASVYKNFQDPGEFSEEVERLRGDPLSPGDDPLPLPEGKNQ